MQLIFSGSRINEVSFPSARQLKEEEKKKKKITSFKKKSGTDGRTNTQTDTFRMNIRRVLFSREKKVMGDRVRSSVLLVLVCLSVRC